MKTVTGNVISSEPIYLFKATKLLSGFVSSDNGASQGVTAYLRRASTAFTELKNLHKEIISSSIKEKKKSKKKEEDVVEEKEKRKSDGEIGSEEKKSKKKRKSKEIDG